MEDTRRLLIACAPTRSREPPTKIHLFDVHEVPAVETTDGFKGTAANQQARSRHPVHDPGSCPGAVRLSVTTAVAVLGEYHAQDRLDARSTECRESSPRRLEVPCWGYEGRTDESERRIVREAVDHRAQSARLQHKIGIANKKQLAGGFSERRSSHRPRSPGSGQCAAPARLDSSPRGTRASRRSIRCPRPRWR
jgi:hypothetical protein